MFILSLAAGGWPAAAAAANSGHFLNQEQDELQRVMYKVANMNILMSRV